MYLHELDGDEKGHFIAFAKHLAKADDNRVDSREGYMINYMCVEMGLDPSDLELVPYSEAEILKVFFRPEAARVLIVEGLGVCYANGHMSKEQESELRALADKLKLSPKFVDQAISVVERQIQVMADFDSLITQA